MNFFQDPVRRCVITLLLLFISSGLCFAQTNSTSASRGKIRGYKVYNARVLVQTALETAPANATADFDSLVKIGKPGNFRLESAGASFDLPLSVNSFKSGGRVEQISFEEARVNGIKMQVEEFAGPFDFVKGIDVPLPRPLKIKIDLVDGAQSLLSFKPTISDFEVTGRVLVFGTFKKFGFKFKRVIPVDFKFRVKFFPSIAGTN
jgi:hypothetical protein